MSVFKLAAICLIVLMWDPSPSRAVIRQANQDASRGATDHHADPDESIELTGVVCSRNPASLKNKTGHDAVIIDIVPDRSWVRKGDVVIQLDDSFLEQKREEQKIEIQTVQAEIAKRERKFSASASELGAAEKVARKQKKVAELDHSRFFGENGKHERAISRQQQLRDLAIERKRLVEQRREQIANDAQNRLDTKKLELKIDSFNKEILFRENKLLSLRGPESDYLKAALELATLEATNRLEIQKSKLEMLRESAESEIQIFQQTLKREVEKLETLDTQLANCLIRASKDGKLHYSTHRNDEDMIEPGETVRDFEEIALIPDMKRLQVEVRLNEAQVAFAKIGQRATIKFRKQDESFPGAILKINDFPESRSWQDKERLYRVYISLDDLPKDLELGEEVSVILLNKS